MSLTRNIEIKRMMNYFQLKKRILLTLDQNDNEYNELLRLIYGITRNMKVEDTELQKGRVALE